MIYAINYFSWLPSYLVIVDTRCSAVRDVNTPFDLSRRLDRWLILFSFGLVWFGSLARSASLVGLWSSVHRLVSSHTTPQTLSQRLLDINLHLPMCLLSPHSCQRRNVKLQGGSSRPFPVKLGIVLQNRFAHLPCPKSYRWDPNWNRWLISVVTGSIMDNSLRPMWLGPCWTCVNLVLLAINDLVTPALAMRKYDLDVLSHAKIISKAESGSCD